MAQRLCDAGHYAQNTIRIQAAKLEREWKSLAAALDDRSTVLSMSVMFHKKAETVSLSSDIMVGYLEWSIIYIKGSKVIISRIMYSIF